MLDCLDGIREYEISDIHDDEEEIPLNMEVQGTEKH